MTTEQVLGSMLIAVVAALVSGFANDFWKPRRLGEMSRRQTEERTARYRKEGLQQG